MASLQDGQAKLGAYLSAQNKLAAQVETVYESQALTATKRGRLDAAQLKLDATREASALALAERRAALARLAAARSVEAASKAQENRCRSAAASFKAKCPEPLGV